MKLTNAEKKNLWDAAKLTAYIAERNRAAEALIYREMQTERRKSGHVQSETVRTWNPHSWKRER